MAAIPCSYVSQSTGFAPSTFSFVSSRSQIWSRLGAPPLICSSGGKACRSVFAERSVGPWPYSLPRIKASVKPEVGAEEEQGVTGAQEHDESLPPLETGSSLEKELNKVVRKTATTFAPRASTANRNPAFPGSTLYKLFETQGYISMAVGGALAFNLLFPSDQADIWRLMGMWSVWMFTIPSLRARDCSSKEKEALNYLFLIIPFINVIVPTFWKSFGAVWSADVVTFFVMYAWKLEWLSGTQKEKGS